MKKPRSAAAAQELSAPATPWQRLLARREVMPWGCWEWMGARSSGYGSIRIGPVKWYTHRLAWTIFNGDIPADRVVDHLCRNRACFNPAHMELVTQTENKLRGASPPAKYARMTHCSRGHEMTPENTYQRPDRVGRMCRACIKLRYSTEAYKERGRNYMREKRKKLKEPED